MKRLILGVTLLTFAVLQCQKKQNKEILDQGIPVRVAAVLKQQLAKPVQTSGRLSSSAEIKLSFKTGGIIDHILVQEGDFVRQGHVLARLKLDEIEARVRMARSGYAKAQRDFERVKNLYADSVATLEQMQDASTGLDVARSNLEIAEFNLEQSSIVAPEDGRVLKRFAEESELIGPGHPVFLFGSSVQEQIVKLGVTDRDVIRLAVGDSAFVQFDAYPGLSFPGSIEEIAGAPDPMSGTFEVRISITRIEQPVLDGFITAVYLFPSQKELYSVIPFEALTDVTGSQGYVFSAKEDSLAEKVPVRIGYLSDDKVMISSGLEDISHVITEGSAYLSDGSRIHIVHP